VRIPIKPEEIHENGNHVSKLMVIKIEHWETSQPQWQEMEISFLKNFCII